jgi:TonB family protein
VIVAAIGAAEGARRLGFLWPARVAREVQPVQTTPAESVTAVERRPTAAVESVTAAEPPATPPDTRVAAPVVAENRASASAPAQATARPKPMTAAGRRGTVRQAKSSDQKLVPVVAPTPAPETPAPVPTKPSALVAAESPRALAPPTGRFFERNDVDEPPQIANRVEPQLPGNLPRRPRNDVVVVRLLVSSTGHPSRVSLLRGSMLGRSSDEAVVAAVTKWTFSPAKKRGEPVNCWYNVGVPLGHAN